MSFEHILECGVQYVQQEDNEAEKIIVNTAEEYESEFINLLQNPLILIQKYDKGSNFLERLQNVINRINLILRKINQIVFNKNRQ